MPLRTTSCRVRSPAVPTHSSESKLNCRFMGGGSCSETCIIFWSSVVRNRKWNLWYFGLWFYPALKKHPATLGSLHVERMSTLKLSPGKTKDIRSGRLELWHWVHLLSTQRKTSVWWALSTQDSLCLTGRVLRMEAQALSSYPVSCEWSRGV